MEYGAFAELYAKRWGIGTKYGELKRKLETENFSGRLVDSVMQDFFATMTAANMLAGFVREADREAARECAGSGNKYEYKVNVNHAVGAYKDRIIGVIIEDSARARPADVGIDRLHEASGSADTPRQGGGAEALPPQGEVPPQP